MQSANFSLTLQFSHWSADFNSFQSILRDSDFSSLLLSLSDQFLPRRVVDFEKHVVQLQSVEQHEKLFLNFRSLFPAPPKRAARADDGEVRRELFTHDNEKITSIFFLFSTSNTFLPRIADKTANRLIAKRERLILNFKESFWMHARCAATPNGLICVNSSTKLLFSLFLIIFNISGETFFFDVQLGRYSIKHWKCDKELSKFPSVWQKYYINFSCCDEEC